MALAGKQLCFFALEGKRMAILRAISKNQKTPIEARSAVTP